MIYSLLNSEGLTAEQAIAIFLIGTFVFFVSIVLREFFKGVAAFKMGDPTPKLAGRLTANPVKHLDPMGFLFFIFVGVGWAKPMPINPLNFKKYKSGIRTISLLGILVNFILGLIAAFIYVILIRCGAAGSVMVYVYTILEYFMIINGALTMFHLIPLFPMDGYMFIASFMKTENKYIKFNQKNGYRTLLLIILASLLIEFISGIAIFEIYLDCICNFIYNPILMLGVL